MTDITELALIKGQKVEAPYYLAECTECGKMYSSSKLIVSRNYFDGDADCYCPHCNADDADIADLGSGEQPAVMAWNYQQARIDVLVEALENSESRLHEVAVACATAEQSLEKAQQYAKERDEENQDLMLTIGRFRLEREGLEAIRAAAEKLVRCKGRYHSEQSYRALAALFGVKTPDLPPLDSESRTVKLPKLKMLEDYLAEVAIEERKQILVGVKLEFHRALAAAGIKVEAE